MIDSHCHLDHLQLYEKLDEVLNRAQLNGVKYLGYVPEIKVKNENGAGDAFSAMFFLCVAGKLLPYEILSLSISLGCLHTMNYKYKNINDFYNRLKLIQKKIIVK